ncbi:Piriformospora indica-insensitive protein 2 [Platanthera guangdongensis]|uniref:Piriformospora indica-insensitive protein 2 n=1 Tax=Platanthera guangdongensis TaxID=2320717 RepID=A0ABR2M3C4_9ASPA
MAEKGNPLRFLFFFHHSLTPVLPPPPSLGVVKAELDPTLVYMSHYRFLFSVRAPSYFLSPKGSALPSNMHAPTFIGKVWGMKKTTALQAILLLLQLLCFGVSSQSDSLTATMDGEEREFLYSAIQGFVGKWWNGSNLYPEPCGWTPIQGVSCDLFDNGMWYVTSIKIGPIFDNSLKCSKNAAFSSNLFKLKNLKRLSLVDCFHQPTYFPSMEWSELSSTLKTLEFRSNKGLIGDIPPVLGQILSLQSLVLTENSLTGEIPWELGNLVSLKRLSLSSNQLSGPLPISLGANLSELLIMDISSNSLSGPLPSSLGRLSSLLKLDLSNNFFSGDLPPELCNLKNLTLLDLGNNGLTGGEEGPAGVEKCINGEDCSQTENSTTSLEISKSSDYMSPGFLWALLVEQGVILSVLSSLSGGWKISIPAARAVLYVFGTALREELFNPPELFCSFSEISLPPASALAK